jgi:gluconokinase
VLAYTGLRRWHRHRQLCR